MAEALAGQLEALILASDTPLTLQRLCELSGAEREAVSQALHVPTQHYAGRGIRLRQVAGGWQFHAAADHAELVRKLWRTQPPKLSRALLETLAIIAYRQPTTRGEIEALRGVKTASSIIGTLLERGWIKVLGRKDVPGRPQLFGTTSQFLVDFGLNSLKDLPDTAQLLNEEEIEQIVQANLETENDEANDDAPRA